MQKRLVRYLRWSSIAVAATVLLTSCATNNRDQEKADLHLRIGTAHLNQGNYPIALKELLEAYKLDPENAVICNNLALAYFVREKHVEAEKYLQRAVALDPKYTDAYNNLGRVHIEMNRPEDAIKELNIVVADLTYPQPERGLANLGLAYYRSGNFSMAEKKFREALKANNSFCPAHNYYGQSLYQQKQYKRAASVIETAIQVCKDLDEARYFGAMSYLRMGQKEKAMARMNEVVELFPNSQYASKARAYLDGQDKDGTQ